MSTLTEIAPLGLFYCPECERLETRPVPKDDAYLHALAEDPASRERRMRLDEVARLLLAARSPRCPKGHRLRGPIRQGLENALRCPRCRAKALTLEVTVLWD